MNLLPALIAVANASDAKREETNQRLLWAGLLFVAFLLAGAALLAWIDRWRKRMFNESSATSVDQLTTFRLSYERGEISEDEYQRIRMRLTGKRPSPEPKIAPPVDPSPAIE